MFENIDWNGNFNTIRELGQGRRLEVTPTPVLSFSRSHLLYVTGSILFDSALCRDYYLFICNCWSFPWRGWSMAHSLFSRYSHSPSEQSGFQDTKAEKWPNNHHIRLFATVCVCVFSLTRIFLHEIPPLGSPLSHQTVARRLSCPTCGIEASASITFCSAAWRDGGAQPLGVTENK